MQLKAVYLEALLYLQIAQDLATADTIDYCVSLIQDSESECLRVDPISKERNTINNVISRYHLRIF